MPEVIKTAFDNIKEAVDKAWSKVGDLIAKIKDITVPEAIKTAFDNIKDAVDKAWSKVGDLIAKIKEISVPEAVKTAFENIKTAIDNVASAISKLIDWIKRISFPFAARVGDPGREDMAPETASPGVAAARGTVRRAGAAGDPAGGRHVPRRRRDTGHRERRAGPRSDRTTDPADLARSRPAGGAGGDVIGTHEVWVYPDPGDPVTGGPALDLSCLVDEVTIAHGRSDATSQPEPASATVNITVGPGTPSRPVSMSARGWWSPPC